MLLKNLIQRKSLIIVAFAFLGGTYYWFSQNKVNIVTEESYKLKKTGYLFRFSMGSFRCLGDDSVIIDFINTHSIYSSYTDYVRSQPWREKPGIYNELEIIAIIPKGSIINGIHYIKSQRSFLVRPSYHLVGDIIGKNVNYEKICLDFIFDFDQWNPPKDITPNESFLTKTSQ